MKTDNTSNSHTLYENKVHDGKQIFFFKRCISIKYSLYLKPRGYT